MSEHKIVPIEPTLEMRNAAIREQGYMLRASIDPGRGDGPAAEIYKAMIAAAPESNTITSLEKQLAECRAVNLVMREALTACDEAMEYMSEYDIPITLPGQVEKALSLNPGDIALVEFGELRNGLWVSGGFSPDMSFKLYHIKTKENKCTS